MKIQRNLIYILVFCIALSIMIISIVHDSIWFFEIKSWITNEVYRTNLNNLAVQDGVHIQNLIDAFRYIMKREGIFYFDYDIVFGTAVFQLLIPFIAAVPAYRIGESRKSIDHYRICRSGSYSGFLWKQILTEAGRAALSIFAAYLAYYLICLAFENTQGNWIIHELFLDILGNDFYHSHLHLYYLLEGTIRFFLIPFVYAVFAETAALFFNDRKQVILFPFVWFYGITALAFVLMRIFGTVSLFLYLCPTTIMANGDYENLNSFAMIGVHLVPLLISWFLIRYETRHREIV